LVEICNPELAKDIDDHATRGAAHKFLVFDDDPSQSSFLSKLAKTYETDVPIELILYTGRTAVPGDLSLPKLRELADSHRTGPFRRVWFLGDKTCEVVAEREPT
jgi:hypothetical protein